MAFAKTVDVVISTASVAELINAINSLDVRIYDIKLKDELNISAKVAYRDLSKLQNYIAKRGDDLCVERYGGIEFSVLRILSRPILCAGILLWMFLILYLPTRILFIQIEGNTAVPLTEILDAAQKSGIYLGASRRAVRSEKLKNILLSEIDQLQWAGVNTDGCTAIITVREKMNQKDNDNMTAIQHIVAVSDGIITDVTVRSGSVMCKPGQAVRKGQLLISGYTDCGFKIQTDQADGEVIALTKRSVSAVSITNVNKRRNLIKKKISFRLQLGKNIIKLNNSSGILDESCVKILKEFPLRLPGGFTLPISLHRETILVYQHESATLDNEADCQWMKQAAISWLNDNMIAGRILEFSERLSFADNLCIYYSNYTCNEMISRISTEELFGRNEK